MVAQAVLGTRDILNPARGALVAQDDSDDFAAQILRILQDPHLHAQLSTDARNYAASWAADVLAARLAAFYRAV